MMLRTAPRTDQSRPQPQPKPLDPPPPHHPPDHGKTKVAVRTWQSGDGVRLELKALLVGASLADGYAGLQTPSISSDPTCKALSEKPPAESSTGADTGMRRNTRSMPDAASKPTPPDETPPTKLDAPLIVPDESPGQINQARQPGSFEPDSKTAPTREWGLACDATDEGLDEPPHLEFQTEIDVVPCEDALEAKHHTQRAAAIETVEPRLPTAAKAVAPSPTTAFRLPGLPPMRATLLSSTIITPRA